MLSSCVCPSVRHKQALYHVCMFVYPHDISKNNGARITKLDIEMFHDESWKPIYFGFKTVKGKVTSHKDIATGYVRMPWWVFPAAVPRGTSLLTSTRPLLLAQNISNVRQTDRRFFCAWSFLQSRYLLDAASGETLPAWFLHSCECWLLLVDILCSLAQQLDRSFDMCTISTTKKVLSHFHAWWPLLYFMFIIVVTSELFYTLMHVKFRCFTVYKLIQPAFLGRLLRVDLITWIE